MHHRETTLAAYPGTLETERVVLMLITRGTHSQLELRQQSWGEGVGWFTQSSVQLEPRQVAELKQTLGQTAGLATRRPPREPSTGGFVPRVVHAESA